MNGRVGAIDAVLASARGQTGTSDGVTRICGRRALDPSSMAPRPGADAALVAGIAAFHVLDHRRVPERFHPYSHAAAGVAAAGVAAALGSTLDDLGLAPDRILRGARDGFLASLPVLGVLALAPFVPALEPFVADPRVVDLGPGDVLRRAVFEIPIGTALYEELVFRSALLARVQAQRESARDALIVTSALFGLWHVLPALEDRRQNDTVANFPVLATVAPTVISTAVAGALFTHLRRRSGSVAAPIVMHALVNGGALLAAVVGARRRRTPPGSVAPPPTTAAAPPDARQRDAR